MKTNRLAIVVVALTTGLACSPPGDDAIDRVDQNLAPSNGSGGSADSAADAAKAQAEANRKREAYLNTKYPGERGQSFSQTKTLYAAIRDISVTARNDVFPPTEDVRPGPFTSEYVTGLYQGKYGDNYYFQPKKGEWDTDAGIWRTVVHKEDFPARPEIAVWGSVHNHTRGHGPESPIDANGLNLTPIWVVTDDGKIWVYPPKTGKAKAFGTIDGQGNIVTAYNTLEDAVNPDYDVYAEMESGGSSCGFWCWAGIVLGVSTGGSVASGAIIGAASDFPPSGSPPGEDPTQICRQSNGGTCS